MGKFIGCEGCNFYLDDGREIFGSNPHCLHDPKPDNIDSVVDYDENCEFNTLLIFIQENS
jgi:hypothetical protein